MLGRLLAVGVCLSMVWTVGCGDDGAVVSQPTGPSSSGVGGGGAAASSSGSAGGATSSGSGGAGGMGTGGSTGNDCTATAITSTTAGCVLDWAGSAGLQGTTNAIGQAARFNFVAGMASAGGFLYVSDNHAIRRVDLATADVTLWLGASGSMGYDDTQGSERFDGPVGLATDGARLWIADAGNAVIREVNIANKTVTTVAGQQGTTGNNDAQGTAATFANMRELAWDGTYLYLIEGGAASVLRRIDPGNGYDVVTLAGQYNNAGGPVDGAGATAQFSAPRFVTSVAAGEVYVADTENHRPRRVTVSGSVGTVSSPYGMGAGYSDGVGTAALFRRLRGLAYDGSDRLFVGDADNFVIRQIVLSTNTVSTIAGSGGTQSHAVGVGSAALFDKPFDIHFDSASGDLFIAEGTVIRRMIQP
jgi:hypothetical protein